MGIEHKYFNYSVGIANPVYFSYNIWYDISTRI